MRPILAGLALLSTVIAFGPTPVAGQTADTVPFLPPEVAPADGSRIAPHRLELEETSRVHADSTELDSYTYVMVEPAQAWDERQLVIEWEALTWNGTGFDRNVVAEQGLAIRGRTTPRDIPNGVLQSSHYYPGRSNLVRVNPDGDLHRYPTLEGRETGSYNEIVFPYLLAAMDLSEGQAFVVPTFNPYRPTDPLAFRYFVVRERVVVEDELGHRHGGWRVDGASRATLEEARALHDAFPEAHARYFVSAEAPYFLGKEWIAWPGPDGYAVDKRWRLTVHETLDVSTGRRMDEILELRAVRAVGQVIPWRSPPAGPGLR